LLSRLPGARIFLSAPYLGIENHSISMPFALIFALALNVRTTRVSRNGCHPSFDLGCGIAECGLESNRPVSQSGRHPLLFQGGELGDFGFWIKEDTLTAVRVSALEKKKRGLRVIRTPISRILH
jgi:hypothetical protein